METQTNNQAALSDREAIARCLGGQAEAFRVVIRRYQPIVRAWLARKHHIHDTDDIVQETFLRAWRGLDELKEPEKLGAWLLGIAYLVVLETVRTEKKHKEVSRMKTQPNHPGSQSPAGDYELEEALESLPEPYRNLVMMRYFSGLTCREVATQMEMPIGTVTKMLSRAYQMLRERLAHSLNP